MQIKYAWLSAMLMLTFCLAKAQDCHEKSFLSVQGSWTAFAQYQIDSTSQKGMLDEDGNTWLIALCPGATYTISIFINGQKRQFHIIQADTIRIDWPSDLTLQEVVVSGTSMDVVTTETTCSVDFLTLESKKAAGLAEVVRQLPGVSVLQTGSNIAKPVIQGLHSNRIVIVSDNVVLESQQWGAEHAPEVDPFTADSVAVVKGASGLQYGPGAMGGAILLIPAPIRSRAGHNGWFTSGLATNSRSGVLAGAIDMRNRSAKAGLRLQGTFKRGGNMHSPDYYLYNTGHQEINMSALGEWKSKPTFLQQASVSLVQQKLGVLKSAHIGNTSDILKAIELDTPFNNINRFSYDIGRPRQEITHITGKYRFRASSWDNMRIISQFTHQFNQRREYDVVRKSGNAADKAQVSFRLWTNTLDVNTTWLGRKYLRQEGGIQIQHQLNYVNKGAFIPDYSAWKAGIWVSEKYHRFSSPWEWEGGVRYDLQHTHATTSGNSNRNLNTKVIFGNASAGTGVHYHFDKHLSITLHTGYAWRPPTVYELFARGVHHGAGTYEQGDSSLIPEKAWNTNLTFGYAPHEIYHGKAIVTFYRNAITDFIYLDPQLTVVSTVRGPYPAWFYKQGNAELLGLDAELESPAWKRIRAEIRISLIKASRLVAEGGQEPLPLIPSNRFLFGIKWETGGKLPFSIQTNCTKVNRQQNAPITLLSPPPAGYTAWNIVVNRPFIWQKLHGDWGISVYNLTNVRYREYLNFFRYYADEPGRNISVRVKVKF